MDIFLDEFDQLLQCLVTLNVYLVISGDFNLWWGTVSDDVTKFSDLLTSYDLNQHVTKPTNAFNHILDLVITSNYSLNNKTAYSPYI